MMSDWVIPAIGAVAIAAAVRYGGRMVRYLIAPVVGQIASDLAVRLTDMLTPSIVDVTREEIEDILDEKLRIVHYHLGPNGDTPPMHQRIGLIEQTLHTRDINQAAAAETPVAPI